MRIRKLVIFHIIFLSLAFIMSNECAADPADDTLKYDIRILTIGNSFARNACQYLEEITESVEGCSITIVRANIGGCSLEKHANLIKKCEEDKNFKPYQDRFSLKELIKMHAYDFITIQQVSSLSFKYDSFQPHADILFQFIREHAPQAKIIIHQTWAYHPKCERLKQWNITRNEMHTQLVENYNELAHNYNTFILPSGNAFYQSYLKNPDINLWSNDGYHANTNGSYLAGCAWFGFLFNISPSKIKFIPDSIDNKTAGKLKSIAYKLWMQKN